MTRLHAAIRTIVDGMLVTIMPHSGNQSGDPGDINIE